VGRILVGVIKPNICILILDLAAARLPSDARAKKKQETVFLPPAFAPET
jgi:hypothetical protein